MPLRMTVSSAVAQAAASECLLNSQSLISDAIALGEERSYGHATALLVLAEEEMGKASIWSIRASGVEYERRLTKRNQPLERDHVAKQSAKSFFMDFLDNPLVDVLLELRKSLENEPDPKKRYNKVKRFWERLPDLANRAGPGGPRARMQEDLRRLGSLQRNKNAGLYVAVGKNGQVSSPKDFSRKEFNAYLKLVVKRIQRFARVVESYPRITDEQFQTWKKAVEQQGIDIGEGLAKILSNIEDLAYGRAPIE